jgi:hypothetical protein
MRVKALILLALASLILLGTAGVAMAEDIMDLSGLPGLSGATGISLANGSGSYGFPALGSSSQNALAPEAMMNWLSSDEDLIAIRPKDPEDRKLSLTRAQMNRVLYASLFGLPLLVVASGLFVWWRRRA